MNEFQTSLLLIGVIAIAGVFIYNKWQERRAGRAADEMFRSRHLDVLSGDGEARSLQRQQAVSEQTRVEPGMASSAAIATDNSTTIAAVGPTVPPIDYVIELSAEQPVALPTVHEHWAGTERRFSGRAALLGWRDETWTVLPSSGTCGRLRAMLQVVSRKGVVNESVLLEFRAEIETLAVELGLNSVSPEMRESLEAARALDSKCAEADIQIAFHVVAVADSAFPGTKLRAAAEASGLVLGDEGRFLLKDDSGRELYALSDRSGKLFSPATMKDMAPQAVTLSMDVPRAPDTKRTFEAMVKFGRHLAALLGGTVVDDNDQPLDDRSVEAIDMQLVAVRMALNAQGISPGSPLALRLFS